MRRSFATAGHWSSTADGAPLGWIDASGVRKHRGGASLRDSVTSVGALFRPGGNLSQALDAALSSPAAMGVAVDKAGKVIGGVLAARCAGRLGIPSAGLVVHYLIHSPSRRRGR